MSTFDDNAFAHVNGFDILFCVLCRIIGSGVYEESEVDWVELSKGWTW